MMKKYKKIILILSLAVIFGMVIIFSMWKSRPLKNTAPQKKTSESITVNAPKHAGKIAIVIDDWGYSIDNLELLKQIKYPLTLAILPNLNYSEKISREARAENKEVILHLPMEPHERAHMEKNTIMVSMNEEAIRRIVDSDLDNIIYARGVSNHMGSAVKADRRTMSIIFEELKKRNLYFLDSLVSSDSVCNDAAGRIGIGFVKRNVFLDNENNFNYIESQIERLKAKALQYGHAVGIGHARKLTLEVLKKAMPQAVKEGYKFVYASDLVQE